jgi:hypothetical protein
MPVMEIVQSSRLRFKLHGQLKQIKLHKLQLRYLPIPSSAALCATNSVPPIHTSQQTPPKSANTMQL